MTFIDSCGLLEDEDCSESEETTETESIKKLGLIGTNHSVPSWASHIWGPQPIGILNSEQGANIQLYFQFTPTTGWTPGYQSQQKYQKVNPSIGHISVTQSPQPTATLPWTYHQDTLPPLQTGVTTQLDGTKQESTSAVVHMTQEQVMPKTKDIPLYFQHI